MQKNNKINNLDFSGEFENIGLLMWKLEALEEFFPCYKSMIKK